MKFSCYKADLAEAVQFVISAVAVKPQTPILSGIYLKAEDGSLELQANNFTTGIITRIPVNVEVSGETVVSGKRFQDFVRNMPDETITLAKEQNLLTLSSGGAKVELLTMNAEDFPKVKSPDAQKSFKIYMSTLRNLIRRTVFAAEPKDISRPIFTGCCFEVDDKISVVATNTHRLAVAKDKLVEGCEACKFIVPAETLKNLSARLVSKDAEEVVAVHCDTRSVSFSFDDCFVTARLIAGEYPPYDKVIPQETATNITVDTAEFKRVIDFIALMAKETEYNTVKFDISNRGMDIYSSSPEVGGANQSVEVDFTGADLSVAFNVNYISDVLKVVDGKRLHIGFNDRYSPAKFIEPDNPDYIYVATPVRA